MTYHTLKDILERTEREGDCMIWCGGKHVLGYGMMRQDGEMRTVHSVIAEMIYGERPDKYNGVRVTRTCDNKACVNPDHIIIRSSSEIQSEAFLDGRSNSKFTMDEAREIRRRFKEGSWGIGTRLAEEYGVATSTIYAIVANKMYKDRTNET